MSNFCGECGSQNDDQSQFCQSCGNKMSSAQPPQEGYQQAPQQGNQQTPQQGYQQPPQQGYGAINQFQGQPGQQMTPGQVFRPTGITILMVLLGIGLVISILGIGSSFENGAISGIIGLIVIGINAGTFYAMYGMKKWGVKFIISSKIFGTVLSAINLFVLTPMLIRDLFANEGFTEAEIDNLVQFSISIASIGFYFSLAITGLILAYIYSKRELFIHD